MHSRMKVSTFRVLVMMAVLAVWAAMGSAVWAAKKGSAATVASGGNQTIKTSRGETIIFQFQKYASVSDKVSGGIHIITLGTGCYSVLARSSMLVKIDYWLKTHRRGQTRVGASPPTSSDTQVASPPTSSDTQVSNARIKHH